MRWGVPNDDWSPAWAWLPVVLTDGTWYWRGPVEKLSYWSRKISSSTPSIFWTCYRLPQDADPSVGVRWGRDKHRWYKVFAWLPVHLEGGGWAWLEPVYKTHWRNRDTMSVGSVFGNVYRAVNEE